MAKFLFRLQGFLNLKVKVEDQKKLAYAQALRKLEEAKQLKQKLENEKENSISSFKKGVQERIDSFRFQQYNNHIELMKKKIQEQNKVIALAQENAERKRLDLVEAVKERKMLETLKEKAHVEYVNDEKIAEQKIVDEIVSYQYNDR